MTSATRVSHQTDSQGRDELDDSPIVADATNPRWADLLATWAVLLAARGQKISAIAVPSHCH